MVKRRAASGIMINRALILSRDNSRAEKISRLLEKYCRKVWLLPGLENIKAIAGRGCIDLIVVADLFNDREAKKSFPRLRHSFPNAAILCLLEHITEDVERFVRSSRVIFLGSYEYFVINSSDILQSACARRPETATWGRRATA